MPAVECWWCDADVGTMWERMIGRYRLSRVLLKFLESVVMLTVSGVLLACLGGKLDDPQGVAAAAKMEGTGRRRPTCCTRSADNVPQRVLDVRTCPCGKCITCFHARPLQRRDCRPHPVAPAGYRLPYRSADYQQKGCIADMVGHDAKLEDSTVRDIGRRGCYERSGSFSRIAFPIELPFQR